MIDIQERQELVKVKIAQRKPQMIFIENDPGVEPNLNRSEAINVVLGFARIDKGFSRIIFSENFWR